MKHFLCIVLMAFASNLLLAQYGTPVSISQNMDAISVIEIDTDFDGDLDVVASDLYRVVFYRNDESIFGIEKEIARPGGDLYYLDLDGNGDEELVVIQHRSVYVIEHTGINQFSEAVLVYQVETDNELVRLGFANTDGNNLPDLLLEANSFGTYIPGDFHVATNVGNYNWSVFSLWITMPNDGIGNATSPITLVDMDDDSDDDIIFRNDNYQVSWIENLADGTFGSTTLLLDDLNLWYSYSFEDCKAKRVDLNDDGVSDLVMMVYYVPQEVGLGEGFVQSVFVFLNDGSNNYTQSNFFQIPVSYFEIPSQIWLEDMNGDGDIDFVATKYNQYVIEETGVYYHDLELLFFPDVLNSDGNWEVLGLIEDTTLKLDDIQWLDPDAQPELLLRGEGLSVQQINASMQLSGNQLLANEKPGPIVEIGDINNDGFTDIITKGYWNDVNKYLLFTNDGSGNFGNESFAFDEGSPLNGTFVGLANINGDQFTDLLSVEVYDELLFLVVLKAWESDGAGNYSLAYTSPPFEEYDAIYNYAFLAQDLNADGADELFVYSRDVSYLTQSVLVMLNDGNGNFTSDVTTFFMQFGSYYSEPLIHLSDLNSDGSLDIHLSSPMSSSIYLPNDGTNHFDAPEGLSYFSTGWSSLLDYDLDGLDDIVTVGYDYLFYYALNDGNGNFFNGGTQPLDWTIDQNYILNISTADVDFDSKTDILINGKVLTRDVDGSFIEPLYLKDFIQPDPMGRPSKNSTFAEINGDDKIDVISYANDLVWWPSDYSSPFSITVQTFNDSNGNSVYDTGESPLAYMEVEISNDAVIWTDSSGYRVRNLVPGDYFVELEYDNVLWDPSTPTLQSFSFNEEDVNFDIFFGLTPIGEVYSVEADITSTAFLCENSSQVWIFVENNGNINTHGTVSIQVPDDFEFTEVSPAPLSMTETEIVWEYNTINPNAITEFGFFVQTPGAEALGQTFGFDMEVLARDENENVMFTLNESSGSILNCAFDPNDKQVNPVGWTSAGYILNDTWLEYTVRFQNTGNYPATDVVIVDPLADELDWNSVEAVSWSHDISLIELDENGELRFHFLNINLPDSSVDFLLSQGFVKFRIKPLEDLPAMTPIENTAFIYFDLNDAVVTNTVLNTIFSCDGLADFELDFDTGCPGTYVLGGADSEFGEVYTWTIDSEVVSEGITLYTAIMETGVYNVVLNVTNALCDVSSDLPFEVYAVEIPEITWNGIDLVVSGNGDIQWMLNGMPIDGATSSEWTPVADGSYTVSVVDENGCYALSESFNYVGIDEMGVTGFLAFPNPFSENLIVEVDRNNIGQQLTIYDVMGKVVFSSRCNSQKIIIESAHWTSGLYEIEIGKVRQRVCKF